MKKGKNFVKNVKGLNVYAQALKVAMEIFDLTAQFPKEEKYSLADQMRRLSRSVCSNLAEGWEKRRYIAMFVNKITEAIQEASETQTWLDFSLHCGYCSEDSHRFLTDQYEQIKAQLITMIRKAKHFCKF